MAVGTQRLMRRPDDLMLIDGAKDEVAVGLRDSPDAPTDDRQADSERPVARVPWF
jgi:hypothetical protein